MKYTKIICTIGPSTRSPSILSQMLREGMDVARLNFSHGNEKSWDLDLEALNKAIKDSGKPTALMGDTRGPEIRTGLIKGYSEDTSVSVKLGEGEDIIIIGNKEKAMNEETTSKKLYVDYEGISNDVARGQRMYLDDGRISMKVLDIKGKEINVRVENEGELKSRKGLNIPGVILEIPCLTEQDKENIRYGIGKNMDILALSFVRNGDNVLEARKYLDENRGENVQIISKIENAEGIENLDEIIQLSDGIMVARGDLGVDIPIEDVPATQYKIIQKCLKAKKVVITATEMLDSMTRNPTPTRAEVNDVYNTVRQATSCVMLSAETASGKYPIKAVKAMSSIIRAAESSFDYQKMFRKTTYDESLHITPAVCRGVIATAYNLNAKAIIAYSDTGHTARNISAFRPKIPVIVATPNEKVVRQTNILWGTKPVLYHKVDSIDTLFKDAEKLAERMIGAEKGDTIIIVAGTPVGIPGSTNTLRVSTIGNVILRGIPLAGGSVRGSVRICIDNEDFTHLKEDEIAVLPKCSAENVPMIRKAAGVLTESRIHEKAIAETLSSLGIPVITDVRNAVVRLSDGDEVEIIGDKGVVLENPSVSEKV